VTFAFVAIFISIVLVVIVVIAIQLLVQQRSCTHHGLLHVVVVLALGGEVSLGRLRSLCITIC
jgi:hypothetical protein